MSQTFSVVTWNVNSIRTRLEHVQHFLQTEAPDVLCLQETKVANDLFPALELQSMGYEVAFHGQKSYNGVAILAKQPLQNVQMGLGGEDIGGCRAIRADVALPSGEVVTVQNVYVPQGQALDSEKFVLKEQFYGALTAELQSLQPQNLVLCGDFNIAPFDTDVDSPKRWQGKVMFTENEKEWLAGAVKAGNLQDCLLQAGQNEVEKEDFSWWDYRTFGYRNTTKWDAGLRIDHLYATPALWATTQKVSVGRAFREMERPSDHAPVMATFHVTG